MFFTFMLERSATQPVPAQVLYAGGEREGGGVDGGRGGVPQTQTPKGLLSWECSSKESDNGAKHEHRQPVWRQHQCQS